MTTSQLEIYNGALVTYLGQRAISSLTVNEQSRYLLDNAWNERFISNCLEVGEWEFAMRSDMFTANNSITPGFGFQNAFQKPSDWHRTAAVCLDPYFRIPLNGYVDEAGYWYSDDGTIYVRYVSDDPQFGGDMTLWPESFIDWIKCRLATRICKALTNSTVDEDDLRKLELQLEKRARANSIMSEPTQPMAQGTWARSRISSMWRGRC